MAGSSSQREYDDLELEIYLLGIDIDVVETDIKRMSDCDMASAIMHKERLEEQRNELIHEAEKFHNSWSLNERERDLVAREDEFRTRAAAGMQEIEATRKKEEDELARLQQERAAIENKEVELQRMIQTRQDDLDRREEILRQKEDQMKKEIEQLKAEQETLNKDKTKWKKIIGVIGNYAHVPEGREGEEVRRSLDIEMDTLLVPHLTSPPSGSGVMISDPVEMPPLEVDQAQSDFTRETRSERRVEERDATAEVEVEVEVCVTRVPKSRKKASKATASGSKTVKKKQRNTAASSEIIEEEEESEPGTPKTHRRYVARETWE